MFFMDFYLPRVITDHTKELKKNGWDVLFLLSSLAIGGKVRNVHPGMLANLVGYSYQQISNGLKYLESNNIVSWSGDTIELNFRRNLFTKGSIGYFAVHHVFASEEFIKNVGERGKRLAVNILRKGLGARSHKKASAGWRYKTKFLMKLCRVDRPHRLDNILDSLSPYFDIDRSEPGFITIKVKKEYIVAARKVENYSYSYSALYYILKEKNIYIQNKKDLADVLGLCNRYSLEVVSDVFDEVKSSWHKAKSLGAWLHSIILNSLKFTDVYRNTTNLFCA